MNDPKNQVPPMQINKVTPEPKQDAVSVTGLVKDDGRVSGYRLSDGETVTKEEGVRLAKENRIKGVAVAERKGSEYLRSLPDEKEGNNLGNLPAVTDDGQPVE